MRLGAESLGDVINAVIGQLGKAKLDIGGAIGIGNAVLDHGLHRLEQIGDASSGNGFVGKRFLCE